MRHLLRLPIASGSLLLLTLAALSAQQPAAPPAPATSSKDQQTTPQDQQPPPRFRTEANFVRVDVFPSRDGRPVDDLRAEEFEVFENNARQSVQTFEHVVISPAGPQSLRAEASTVRGAEQLAANPRNRVFVIFLDIPHVAVEGSHHIKEPLIRLIDRVLGPDDLIAVMTPEMSAQQITFGRKTEVIADMLRDKWYWGERHSILPMDEREIEYKRCYPEKVQEALVEQMIARRRERMVLDALRDLVTYLGGVREERKALLTISEGWLLYRPDTSMTKLRVVNPRTGATEPVPGVEPVGVDEFGKLRVGGSRVQQGEPTSQTACDRDRMHLASIDNDDYFRFILDLANRNNATFYPIDPRGLAAFDYPIGPKPPPSLAVDHASLRQRLETLQTLAENTDGIAVINSNNLDAGLRRIADDLTSYYLLGYYSTNAQLDGRYRRIDVRVKRPGVSVRARRGYRAPTAEEVKAARAAAEAPVPASTKTADAALSTLSRMRAEQRFSIYAIAIPKAEGNGVSGLWIAGEVVGPPQEFARGGTAAIDLSGGAAASVSVTLKPGERSFLTRVPLESANTAVDVKARLSSEGASQTESDAARIDPAAVAPLLFRRGPSTGNRVQPAADLRFSRTERLRLELPVPTEAKPGAGRILDRNGQTLQVPLTTGEKTDADGQRWLTGDATLSPLGAGDYLIELAYTVGRTERKILTAIRVTR